VQRTEPTIAQVALPPASAGAGRRRLIAGAVTVAAHAGLAAGLLLVPPPEQAPAARIAPAMRIVEIAEAPPPPPPPPEPEVAPAPEPPPAPVPAAPPVRETAKVVRKEAPPQEAPASKPAAGPVAPAQAGQVLAREAAPPDEVLDFTDFDVASGSGATYVGGVTSATGTNTVAVHGGDVAKDGAVGIGVGSTGSRARTVMLPDGEWDCPWPDEARGLGERVQEVVLRVVVRADGTVTRAELVSDPGHGFGAAALRCARSARFDPALDAAGRPIDATSPPIRVRFTR